MRRVSMKAILGTSLALLGGCATTIEMGPGYYHYDTGLARSSAPAPSAVTSVYQEPAVVYREPTLVYRDSAVIYHEPMVDYRPARDAVIYTDHGQ